MTIDECGIQNNTGTLEIQSSAGAGGILNAGTLTVRGSMISNNTFSAVGANSAGAGGGVCNTGTLSVLGSTIEGNTSAADGGGLYNSGV